jgi:hypothetical protein
LVSFVKFTAVVTSSEIREDSERKQMSELISGPGRMTGALCAEDAAVEEEVETWRRGMRLEVGFDTFPFLVFVGLLGGVTMDKLEGVSQLSDAPVPMDPRIGDAVVSSNPRKPVKALLEALELLLLLMLQVIKT